MLAPGLGLGGCADAPAGTSAWIYITLTTAALAVGAYLLGTWRARAAAAAALSRCRADRRRHERLQADWAWETDAMHHLLRWRAPGQAPGAAPDGLFPGGVAVPPLAERLQAKQAFSGLRLRADAAPEGSRGWELRGEPRWDELGAFGGFTGSARSTDADDALRAVAAALAPALAEHAAPALLLGTSGGRWRLQQANAAALQRWPDLAAGADRADALARLPAAVAEAGRGLAAGEAAEAADWRLWALGDESCPSLLLVQRLAPAVEPTAMAPASEGDIFSLTLSHDLRAPIRVVEGFTRIVKEDYGRLLDRVGNDHLDRVLGAAARMNLMIDALLTLARLSSQPLARQPVNLSQLAGWVVDDLRRGAPERVADIDIEPGLTVQGDPTLLRQVLENLLGNAWKYSSRRERAQISLRRVQRDGRPAYEVRDNGAGFDMRSAERLFGLFQRLHSASDFPGHGVGLASVRRIVRRHGGDVWAEAEPGQGAAFFFTLA